MEYVALGSLFVFFFLGVPVGIALLGCAILIFMAVGNLPMMAVAQQMVGGIDNFVLIAVPLFILAAKIMNSALIADRIFHFAGTLVRHIRGGLAHVNILASLIFAGMTGSAVAEAAGLGELEIKAMRERGYPAGFAAAVTASASVIGPIFPPSVPFIVFGSLAGASIGSLFLAGILPGVLMAVLMLVAAYLIALRRGFPSEARASLDEIWQAFKGAFFPLLSPIIILVFIVFGITTPTEAACVAVLYSIVLAACYRSLSWKQIPKLLIETGVETGVLMFIFGAVSAFTWIITFQGIPQQFMGLVFNTAQSPMLIILIMVGMLFLLGLFMETSPGLIVATPFLLPIAEKLHMDPVHLGVIMVLVLDIGLITPPVGICLFIVARIAKIDVLVVARECIPFLLALLVVVMAVAFIPQVTMWIPGLLLGK